jgi:hypothetical protein
MIEEGDEGEFALRKIVFAVSICHQRAKPFVLLMLWKRS